MAGPRHALSHRQTRRDRRLIILRDNFYAEVPHEHIRWAGWQPAQQGSRGENGGYLHLELNNPITAAKATDKSPPVKKTRGGRKAQTTSNDSDGDHSFAHFAAGGPRSRRNTRLRALVSEIISLSAESSDSTGLQENAARRQVQVERIGRSSEGIPVVVGRASVGRIHFTPTAIVQLDQRYH